MNQENIHTEVRITGRLCKDHILQFDEAVEKLFSKNSKVLSIIIDSPGGDANVAIKISNHINKLIDKGINVITHGNKLVGSGALLIFLHGIRRTLDKFSFVVVDLPFKVYDKKLLLGYPETGQFLKQLIEENDLIQLSRIEYAETISRITNQPIEIIYKLDDDGKRLTASEALQLGFCQEIL